MRVGFRGIISFPVYGKEGSAAGSSNHPAVLLFSGVNKHRPNGRCFYQIFTRLSGDKYILSFGVMSNVSYQAGI